jgi:hypothetical protein
MTTSESHKPNWFAASWFGQFMASTAGRLVRIGAGIALIAIGLLVVGDVAGLIIAAIGIVPLLAGAVDICIFSRLFGGPLAGTDIRACARR